MKWTAEQMETLKQMCFAGTSNADMAKIIGVPVEEVHHKRSQLGLTIAKVKALNSNTAEPAAPKAQKPAKATATDGPAATATAPAPAPAALERFQNAGEDCIVLQRCVDIALIVMPGKRIAAFCVPLQHRAGDTSWWFGHYFDTLTEAYEYYCERVIEDEDED